MHTYSTICEYGDLNPEQVYQWLNNTKAVHTSYLLAVGHQKINYPCKLCQQIQHRKKNSITLEILICIRSLRPKEVFSFLIWLIRLFTIKWFREFFVI